MKPSAAEVQHAAFDGWPTVVISGDSYVPRLQQELDGRFHIYFNTPEEGG